ncbi:MAG TPA: hypothetical protein HPP83_04980 [Candidatus Hydrogenedentes bacterium]|nr:hypothetical protein [Candidatus Hydrogenedentota bacterium]
MRSRDLFDSIMHYGAFDRMPVWHWGGWGETVKRWREEGLPEDVSEHEFLNAEPMWAGVPINMYLHPAFEEETIEETEKYRIFRQSDGVVAQHFKDQSALPHFIDFLLKDRSGWPEYEKRLQPDPARIPDDLDETLERLNAGALAVAVPTGSMVGWLRDWMGVQNFCVTCCVDPDFVGEVANTIADLVCWGLDQVMPKIRVDLALGWEDICFKTGPLIQPDVFECVVKPAYRKVSDKLLSYGCDLHAVDCDGWIEPLMPHWLDGGVNVMFPCEVGTWDADVMAWRRKYGRDMRFIGGINKLVLERERKDIDAEIERRKPLMAEGGYIPLPDHLVTPDTPLDNCKYYLDKIREIRF